MDTMIKQCLMIIVAVGMLAGCSRPGHTEVEPDPDPFQYVFEAEDAALVGLVVSDNVGTLATEISPGIYQFADDYVPVVPITFLSDNLSELNTTFQDIDGDGEKTAADIEYNVGLEIAYIGSFEALGERKIFANPVTALIPSTGVPSSGIAGLPEEVFQLAFLAGIAGAPATEVEVSDGVTLSIKTILSRTATLLTALQEGIVKIESNTAQSVDISIAVLASFRDSEPTSGLIDTTQFGASMQSAIGSHVNQESLEKVNQLADSLGDVMATLVDITFYESIVLAVQKNVSATSSVNTILNKLTELEVKRLDQGMQYSIRLATEIAASGGMAAFLDSLSVVPISVGNNGQSLVDAGVADFNLEFIAASGLIKVNALNAFFDQSEFTYYFDDDLYGVKVDADHAALIAMNANETNLLGAAQAGVNSARLLALCWNDVEQNDNVGFEVCGNENANLEFYGLATEEEICAAEFDGVELAKINSLNRQQISCN